MTSLRWLKLNRTGLCYLPEELAALQKLVSPMFWDGMGLPCPTGAVRSAGSLFPASLVAQWRMLWCLIIALSYNVWLKSDAGAVGNGVEMDLHSVSPCFPRKPDEKSLLDPLPCSRREG